MTCTPLADTGLDGQVGLLVLVALAALVVGTTFLLARRRRRAGLVCVSLAFLVLVAGAALVPAAPAEAATSECVDAGNSLTVVQTSSLRGLAPGIDPVAITGVVTNNGDDRTGIAAVDVEITSVTTPDGSSTGACDAGDYLIAQPHMIVARTIEPGGSVAFGGATIGFDDKPTNQDACQNATIHLLYTANPE